MNNFIKVESADLASVEIGSYKNKTSNVTEVPLDCLDAAISWFEYRRPIAIAFVNAEGNNFIVIADLISSYVIADGEDSIFVKCGGVYSGDDLAKQIYEDISGSVKEWAEFSGLSENEINSKLNKLRDLLEEEGLFDE